MFILYVTMLKLVFNIIFKKKLNCELMNVKTLYDTLMTNYDLVYFFT